MNQLSYIGSASFPRKMFLSTTYRTSHGTPPSRSALILPLFRIFRSDTVRSSVVKDIHNASPSNSPQLLPALQAIEKLEIRHGYYYCAEPLPRVFPFASTMATCDHHRRVKAGSKFVLCVSFLAPPDATAKQNHDERACGTSHTRSTPRRSVWSNI